MRPGPLGGWPGALALLALLGCGPVAADQVLLLVPGHLGTAADWSRSGFDSALVEAGWQNGGTLAKAQTAAPRAAGARAFYTVSLSGLAPLQVQAGNLADLIHALQLRRDDQLIVVGHSVGGVVARLAMVQQPHIGVDTLVTIAAPNLGAPLACVGAELGRSITEALPSLGQIPSVSELARLYEEIGDAGPGSLLAWLNEQPHPPALYVSVVRPEDPGLISFDPIVPAWSQSLGSVPALSGRARVEPVPGMHWLGPEDASWLLRFLAEPGI